MVDLPKSNFDFFIEQKSSDNEQIWSATATLPISNLAINICQHPIFLASDIDFITLANSNFGRCIVFQLNQHAAVEFYKLSVDCIGRKIVFVLNGRPLGISLPISGVVSGGAFSVFPEVEDDQLEKLIEELNDVVGKLKKLKER
jgi:hypothetical protein